jgi:hypothetical protein
MLMKIEEFQERPLEVGEAARCSVCGRIIQSLEENPTEFQYQSKAQQAAAAERKKDFRSSLPREGDIDKRPYVFVHKEDTSNVLCRDCYALQSTTYNPKK